MSGELLSIIERLEREKGISKEILIDAIKSAIASAAYKIIDDPEMDKDEIDVEIDIETGAISVVTDNEEIKGSQFGRIAAQTAKQVMIQKIREAERDVIYNKYLEKVGDIISGAVHRFEKGNIVVELDDTEAIIPRTEQIPRERFRQGQPIRACLVKVERRVGGLDLILSRSSDLFVKKLFEIEVPEIAQNIVEIVAIAREPGERSKIAVYSKEDKIDCVGACVGMRGSRVKEIVKELSGERIDIVRWNDDIQEYVKAAVNPVEVYSLEIDRSKEQIRVAVAKDQLALLIGKKGRNIRLASKLVGWTLEADAVIEDVDIAISQIPGLNIDMVEELQLKGYSNASDVISAGAATLGEIEIIGLEKAEEIVKICEEIIAKMEEETAEPGKAADVPSASPEEETTKEEATEEEATEEEATEKEVTEEETTEEEATEKKATKKKATKKKATKKEATEEEAKEEEATVEEVKEDTEEDTEEKETKE